MRIAFLAERLLLGFGVDLVIDQVASRLAADGHEVTVYAAAVDEAARTGDYRIERLPVAADRIYPRYEARAKRWAPTIDAGGHDAVFVETFPFFSLIPELRTPAIAVDHGISSSEGMSLPRRAMFEYVRRTQYGRYLPRAAAIVVVSEFLRGTLPDALASRARVILNGADHYAGLPREDRDNVRAGLGIEPGETMALYVGRLDPVGQPYKGTRDLMAAARLWRRDGVRLVMAGRGDEADARRVEDAGGIAELHVPPARLAGLLAAADVYVTASRWEGFDLPLAEAQAFGVPGVALDVGAHAEVIERDRTGVLVTDPGGLVREVTELARDPARRRALGDAARARADGLFRWDRAAAEYADIAHGVARPASARLEPERGIDTTVLVLNYGAETEVLESCLASAAGQTHPVDVLLVDNGSPKNRDALEAIAGRLPAVRQLLLDRNYGFAGGVNRGLAEVRTPYVLILNNDAEMKPDCVERMLPVLRSDDMVVGVAPKILFAHDPDVIDAVGNLITQRGSAFNMGIGQLDIGQYDRSERTFGACFAAALIRTEAFKEGRVGPLDESYFMYYEDIDWCFRADLLGYAFLTAPDAVVLHRHSYSMRSMEYAAKYRLIERNFVRTVVKNFERGSAIRAALRRTLAHLVNAFTGRYSAASLRVVAETFVALPRLLHQRAAIQTLRRVPDREIVDFARGERPCFDPERYAPEASVATIEHMYRRKFLLTGDERHRRIAEVARQLGLHHAGSTDIARERLAPLLKDEPGRVLALLDAIRPVSPRSEL